MTIQKCRSSAQPVISVVIPTYNCWPLIRRAILSAAAQTYRPDEIIVVDDGSTDGTTDHVRAEFGDLVRVHSQRNRGPSSARNLGAHLSCGDWLAFLDADDEWEQHKLEQQVAHTTTKAVALVACGAIIRNQFGAVLERRHLPRPFTRAVLARELRFRTTIPMGVLVRKSVFVELGGFSEELSCGEDRELWARIVARHEVAGVDEPLLLITDREDSMSHNSKRVLSDGLVVNRRVQHHLRSEMRFAGLKERIMLRKADSNTYWTAACAAADSSVHDAALRHALRSLWLFPFSRGRAKMRLIAAQALKSGLKSREA